MEHKKYNYFYKITNKTNGKFYYGIHSTDDLNDGYMGSGSRLHRVYKKEGVENFEKEILKFFNTRKEASDYEAEMVTEELVKNLDCYNLKTGGDYGYNIGSVLVKNEMGQFLRFKYGDKELETNEYLPFMKNMVVAKKVGESEFKMIDREEFRTHRNLYQTIGDGLVIVADGNGNFYKVPKDDERIKNGILKPIWSGRKHSEKTKKQMSESHRLNGDQQGSKNSQYGTCWVTNGTLNKKVKTCELQTFIDKGWHKGRKCSGAAPKYIISYEEMVECINNGLTRKEMCDKFNMSRTTTNRLLKKYNLSTKKGDKGRKNQ